MSDRVRIFDRNGFGLCDLRVSAERNWSLTGGEAEFDVGIYDPNCRKDFFRFGNWLLIESDKLEPWVGMIDVPQEWKRRAVHIVAYTPERMFMYRNVPRQMNFSGKSGVVFRQILNLVNYAEATLLEEGDVWEGGKAMQEESLSGDNLLDYVNSLSERSGAEYSFTPVLRDGVLAVVASWSQKIGIASDFPLEESYNLSDEDNQLIIQGEFTNELWGYGNGAGQADRPSAVFRNSESADYYGLRQGSRVYSDYSTSDSVLSALKGEINNVGLPHDVYKLSALDVGETFANLRLGYSYPFRSWTVGFGISARVRVTGMYYDPRRGRVELTFKENVDDISE